MPSVSGNVGAVASVSSVFGRNGGVVAANGDYAGVVAAHLTGATAATRYVGGTASGAPVAGTFAVGDFVIEQTGKVYVCTVAGTPGTWVAQPVTRAMLGSSASVLIASGHTDFLLCDQQFLGDPIFDLSNPSNPAAVASGTYAVTATIRPFDVMAIGDFYYASLEIDALGEDVTVSALSAQAFAASREPLIVLPLTWYCPAGGVLRFSVENDASTDLHFSLLSAFIQRVA